MNNDIKSLLIKRILALCEKRVALCLALFVILVFNENLVVYIIWRSELLNVIHDVLNFEQATSVCAVDYIDRVQIVYHLTNYFTGIVIEITVDLPADDLHVPSVALIWEGANWHERETYELFGVIFDGHPKLERLLTPQSYEFYPFRKSYKLRGSE